MGRVLRNTGYLFSGSTISLALSMVQSIFAARLLGVEGFGLLGMITVFYLHHQPPVFLPHGRAGGAICRSVPG